MLQKAFSWNPGFKEYFAVKATPNPYILSLLKAEGFGGDCSSYPEMVLCDKVGMRGEDVIFTSNDTPAYEYAKAKEMGAIINLDDISHIPYLEEHVGLPELVCCRYNPGLLKAVMLLLASRRRQSMASRVSNYLKDIANYAIRSQAVWYTRWWLRMS